MRGEGVIPSPRRRVSAVPPPAAIARSENRPGSAVSMLRAPVRKTAAACAAVCFLLLAASASAVNVTVAYTVAVRGRLFQFGAFGESRRRGAGGSLAA